MKKEKFYKNSKNIKISNKREKKKNWLNDYNN